MPRRLFWSTHIVPSEQQVFGTTTAIAAAALKIKETRRSVMRVMRKILIALFAGAVIGFVPMFADQAEARGGRGGGVGIGGGGRVGIGGGGFGRVGIGRAGWGGARVAGVGWRGRGLGWAGRPGFARAAWWGGRPGLARAAWWGRPGLARAAWWGGRPGWRRAAWW